MSQFVKFEKCQENLLDNDYPVTKIINIEDIAEISYYDESCFVCIGMKDETFFWADCDFDRLSYLLKPEVFGPVGTDDV